MDTIAKLFLKSISSIYEGTISDSSFYPSLYFNDNDPNTIYYGYRVSNILPSRMFVRIKSIRKWKYMDILWLVDNSELTGEGCITYEKKKKDINIDGEPGDFIKEVTEDATIKACFPDISTDNNVFEKALAGSRECFKEKGDQLGINPASIPCQYIAISTLRVDSNLIQNEQYQDKIINAFLSLIDLAHRTLDLLTKREPKLKSKAKKIFCVRCGYSIPESSYYCPFCGSKQ